MTRFELSGRHAPHARQVVMGSKQCCVHVKTCTMRLESGPSVTTRYGTTDHPGMIKCAVSTNAATTGELATAVSALSACDLYPETFAKIATSTWLCVRLIVYFKTKAQTLIFSLVVVPVTPG